MFAKFAFHSSMYTGFVAKEFILILEMIVFLILTYRSVEIQLMAESFLVEDKK